MLRGERLRHATCRYSQKDGCFHFDEIAIVQEPTYPFDDFAAKDEPLTYFLIRHEVHFTLAESLLNVLEPVPLLRRRT